MLPLASFLLHKSNRFANDFQLLSAAFDVTSLDPLSSDVSLPLAARNFVRVSFSSVHSAHAVRERSNLLARALHLLSAAMMIVRGLSNRLDLGTPAYEIRWCGEVVLAHWAQAPRLLAHYSTRCKQPELWWQFLMCF